MQLPKTPLVDDAMRAWLKEVQSKVGKECPPEMVDYHKKLLLQLFNIDPTLITIEEGLTFEQMAEKAARLAVDFIEFAGDYFGDDPSTCKQYSKELGKLDEFRRRLVLDQLGKSVVGKARVKINDLVYKSWRQIPSQTQKGSEGWDELRASMLKHGQREPVLTTPEKEVIDGHRRIAVAKDLGWEEIDTVATTMDPDEAYKALHFVWDDLDPDEE
jgi:hypothetical protein